ncbi:hypothetical protein LC065_03095 [Halobacillus litoralis]|uniref:hypothetical protein n=1 Tax=Halobacillus litoralis TaxID=45668 RepID=UPI001CFE8091|nr:hypothetical protein [Halobacillus litoralis]WLR48254.1 hypothetical protein LC065_03095 [Halobacillus litoralis]
MKKGTNKSKWILIVVSLMVLAIGAYVYTGNSEEKLALTTDSKPMRKAKSVDLEEFPLQWREVDTFEQVNEFYEERIHGLSIAREKGLTVRPQESTPIPDKDGRMQINEVWHSGPTIHVLYSIDLSALTRKDDDDEEAKYLIQPPSVESVHIESMSGSDKQSFQQHSQPLHPRDTVVFENRVYGLLQIPPITEKWGYNFDPHDVKDYDEEFLTSLSLRIGHRTVETEAVPVRYVHDRDEHVLQSYTPDEVYSDDVVTVEPTSVNIGVASSYVKMKIEIEGRELGQSVHATIKTEEGSEHPVTLYLNETGEENVYEAWFQPVSVQMKGAVSLTLDSLQIQDATPYSFTVDMSPFKEHSNESVVLNEKVGEAHNTNIILEQVDSFSGTNMNLQLKYEPQEPDQKEKVVGAQLAPMNSLQEEREKFVKVVTNEGETIDANLWGHDKRGDIHFQSPELKNAREITVTVNKMVYAHKLGHTFDLNK